MLPIVSWQSSMSVRRKPFERVWPQQRWEGPATGEQGLIYHRPWVLACRYIFFVCLFSLLQRFNSRSLREEIHLMSVDTWQSMEFKDSHTQPHCFSFHRALSLCKSERGLVMVLLQVFNIWVILLLFFPIQCINNTKADVHMVVLAC